ncbi:MAG TPA: hypothetical protein DEB73_00695 [Candidatus Magasanikbacteria bacterium]|nr:hypothetical protein [Candidatus Magasanikbacteria bacterium]HBX16151.1 hypothetical protein [Candidatus Magasanikbacteria bacterium]
MALPAGVHITHRPHIHVRPMMRLLAQLKAVNGARTLPALEDGARPMALLARSTTKPPAHQKAVNGAPVLMAVAGVQQRQRKLVRAQALKHLL